MKRLMIPILLAAVLTVPACGKKDESTMPKTDAGEIKTQVNEAVNTLADKARTERGEFVNKSQIDIDNLNKQMLELKQKAEKATGEAKAKMDQRLQSLEQDNKALEEKFDDLKASTGEKWRELKAGVSDAIKSLKELIKKVKDS